MISPTEARKLCPNIHLAHVQTWKEGDDEPHYHPDPKVKTHKVSLDPYRRASLKILAIFRQYCDRIEKASIDESFLDMSSVVKEKLIERYPELGLPPPYNDMSYALPAAPSVIFSEELGRLSKNVGRKLRLSWDILVLRELLGIRCWPNWLLDGRNLINRFTPCSSGLLTSSDYFKKSRCDGIPEGF